MASVQMDVAEIRRTVHGRNMREPIADACIKVKQTNEHKGIIVKRLAEVDVEEITGQDDCYRLIFDY